MDDANLVRVLKALADPKRFRMVREPFNLTALTQEVVSILRSMADAKKISITVETAAPEIVIEADRELLRRVLNNLGSNAIKFTHEGGTVTFRTTIEGRAVRIQVEDTGIGIPKEGIERIFDKFYQIDSSLSREYPGVGLGLTISKSIVEWHGGEIMAESEAGAGSRFTVLLPVSPGDAHVITHASWTPSRSVSNHLTRLTVEMIAEVMNARTASFMLVDEERSELYIRAARGLRGRVGEVGTGPGYVLAHLRAIRRQHSPRRPCRVRCGPAALPVRSRMAP